MVKCQVCGEEVGDAKFCSNCGSEVVVKKEVETPQNQNNHSNQVHNGHMVSVTQPINKNNAIVLGILVTGLGHIYCGLTRKGVLLIVCAVIGAFFFFIPALIVWVYSLIDLNNTIESLNNGESVEDSLFGF